MRDTPLLNCQGCGQAVRAGEKCSSCGREAPEVHLKPIKEGHNSQHPMFDTPGDSASWQRREWEKGYRNFRQL